MRTYAEWYELMWGDGGEYDDSRDIRKTEVYSQMSVAERIAFKLLEDITDRRGWRQEWDQFEDRVKEEIFQEFVKIITGELG
jgi:hypothetical protein